MSFTAARLSRQARLFGEDAMELIGLKKIFMAGCGRNGSAFATLAAYAGFSKFRLVDPDVVKTHNVNATVPFFKRDVNKPKVCILRDTLLAIDPSIKCEIYPWKLENPLVQEALDSSHVIVDATDSIPAKKFLNEWVSENHKKGKSQMLLSLGSGIFVKDSRILQLGAQATLFEKGGVCLMCGPLDVEDKSNLSRVSFVVVNVLASLLGLQLLLSLLIGYDRETNGKYNFILYDCLSQQVVKLNRVPREDCPLCGRT
jgi:molybdopterin/thiamine biosynthesis adenylyltransferase